MNDDRDVSAALRAHVEQAIGKVMSVNDDPTEYSWRRAQADRGEEMNAFAVPHGAAVTADETRWWESYNAAVADGHDSYDAERIADAANPPLSHLDGEQQ